MELGGEPVMWGSESQKRRRFKEKASEAQEKGAAVVWDQVQGGPGKRPVDSAMRAKAPLTRAVSGM